MAFERILSELQMVRLALLGMYALKNIDVCITSIYRSIITEDRLIVPVFWRHVTSANCLLLK